MDRKLNFENNIINWIPQLILLTSLLYGISQGSRGLMLILTLCMGGILGLISRLVILVISAILGHYSRLGYLYKWYDRTANIMGVQWIIDAWEEICKLNLIENETNINFISPSGNRGKYEKTLFDYIVNAENNINFIVSDKLNLKTHEKSVTQYNSKFTYIPGRDAFDIKKTINECSLSNVNVIWDFKGMIWYSAHGGKKYSKLLKAFENYHSVLTEKGIVVIDNIFVKPATAHRYGVVNLFFNFRIGLGEISTVQRLDAILKKKGAKDIKEYLELNFEKKEIVFLNSKETVARVYVKK